MQKQQDTHSVLVLTLAELIGVSILAILADSSDTIGKVAVAIMSGWLLIFLMGNASFINSLTSKVGG